MPGTLGAKNEINPLTENTGKKTVISPDDSKKEDQNKNSHGENHIIVVTPKNPEKLQKVIDTLEDGDKVLIKAGTYKIHDSLKIAGKDNIVIAGEGKVSILLHDVYQNVFSIENCGTVTLSNLHAQHIQPLPEYECHGAVIAAAGTRKLTVTGCELNGSGAIGITAYDCGEIKVSDCFIHNNSYNAFYFNKVDTLLIIHNVIKDNKSYAQFYQCGNIEMYGNEDNNNTGYWESMGE